MSSKLVFARGRDGVLRVWRRGQRRWRKIRFIPEAPGGGIFFLDGQHGWLNRSNIVFKRYIKTNTVWRTDDGGKTWTKLR